jgi:hypothetical protein
MHGGAMQIDGIDKTNSKNKSTTGFTSSAKPNPPQRAAHPRGDPEREPEVIRSKKAFDFKPVVDDLLEISKNKGVRFELK